MNLTFDGSKVLLNVLMNRKFHGVFIIEPPSVIEGNKELHSIRLSMGEYVLIVPETSRLSERYNVSIKDLADETIIMPSEATLLNQQLTLMFKAEGISARTMFNESK